MDFHRVQREMLRKREGYEFFYVMKDHYVYFNYSDELINNMIKEKNDGKYSNLISSNWKKNI